MGVLLLPQYPLCRRDCMDFKKTKIFKNLNIRDIQNAQHRISPSQKLHSQNCNIMFSIIVIFQICQSKNFSTKTGKSGLLFSVNFIIPVLSNICDLLHDAVTLTYFKNMKTFIEKCYSQKNTELIVNSSTNNTASVFDII